MFHALNPKGKPKKKPAKKHGVSYGKPNRQLSKSYAFKGGDPVALKALREARERGETTETVVKIPNLQERLGDIRQRKENQRTERKNSVITDGFLYLVTSPAYPDWVKVGQTSDYENRLSTYQTASPFADYQMVAVKYVEDRVLSESTFLELANLVFEVKGEWIKASVEELTKDF
jgi:hypothetical protein